MIFLAALMVESTINVFAAASLKDAFTAIARTYENSHKGVKVKLSFAGSQTLAAQIKNGAPADVFASADMKNLIDTGTVAGSIQVFARNKLTIVVRKGDKTVNSPKDLSRLNRLVVADKKVPAGKYAETFFAEACEKYGEAWLTTVKTKIVSRELDVRTVLARVRLGEADAGIVYVTDAKSAGSSVRAVAIPKELNVFAHYPAGVPKSAPNSAGGTSFIRYLMQGEAQKILRREGFLPPIKSK